MNTFLIFMNMNLFVQNCENDAKENESDHFGVGNDGNCAVVIHEVTTLAAAYVTGFVTSATWGRRWHATTFIVSIGSCDVTLIFRIVAWTNGHRQVCGSCTVWVLSTSASDTKKTTLWENLVITTSSAVRRFPPEADLAGFSITFCYCCVVQLTKASTFNISFYKF